MEKRRNGGIHQVDNNNNNNNKESLERGQCEGEFLLVTSYGFIR